MILKLKIKPDSSENKLIEKENIAYVKALAKDNKANIELIKRLGKIMQNIIKFQVLN